MAVVLKVGFRGLNEDYRKVRLLEHGLEGACKPAVTVVTGHNGSQKSTLLRHIANYLISPEEFNAENNIHLLTPAPSPHLLCISGSTADRFPQRERPGRGRNNFDVPNYTYVGQRVMNNLLSRKAPIETVLALAFASEKMERFGWGFFKQAHAHAGIFPEVKCTFGFKFPSKDIFDIKDSIELISRGNSRESARAHVGVRFSQSMARWILKEFSEADIQELQEYIEGRVRYRNISVNLKDTGPASEMLSVSAIRLGLLIGIIKLREVEVHSIRGGDSFSLFELSSGEYNMYSSILAVGFGVSEDTVLLFDEPENNLHPQWQRDLMSAVFEVCSKVMSSNGHVIISTHSPLIVGSAPDLSSVVDITPESAKTSIVHYGASADELLLRQFGVGSSRNKVVVDTVQRAISFVERGDFDNKNFLALVPELLDIRRALTMDDPMIEVIDALIGKEVVE